ncbi:MAG TPA: glycosyltransferase [Ilumatobacter sp.]|nr:glycosyltransferase [Ilumatobacter sp.]
MTRVAVISLHTSPLLQPGSGDSGGMNVYVRELVSALSQAGIDCTTYTRADRPDLTGPDGFGAVQVEPNHRVVYVEAGPHDLPKEALPSIVDGFTDQVLAHLTAHGGADVVHANYWLSGVAAHRIKHTLGIPFVSTFHTLARVKAEGGDPEPGWRDRAEAELINCADAVCVSCESEREQFLRLYGQPHGCVEIVAPGVEHALFGPGEQRGARRALGLPSDVPVVLFVGRLQPLKGPDVAIGALAAMRRTDARLLIVGGASGSDGDAEVARAHALVDELGLADRVQFIEPQPHHILSTYYRAANVVVVPSRSESFGLVALEAAACGIPVVASAVGGLLSLVDHNDTGLLIGERDPDLFAAAIDSILDDPLLAGQMSLAAVKRAREYTWSFAAARLRRLYGDLTSRQLVDCA